MDIVDVLVKLRSEIYKFRNERKEFYISPDISAVEIAMNLVEFCLKRKRMIAADEEIWFKASYQLAHGLDGTQWENVYYLYLDLVGYVEENNFFRPSAPEIKW